MAAIASVGAGPGGRAAAGDFPFAGRFPAGGTLGGFGDFAIPSAGRSPGQFSRRGGVAAGTGFNQDAQVDNKLVTYLEAHRVSATYLFATLSSQTAAPYIIVTGKPVMALGGFSGSDQILTLSQLKTLIRTGQVKYFLLSGGFGGAGGAGGAGNSQLVQWVESHGTLVSASAYGGSAAGSLYEVSASAAS